MPDELGQEFTEQSIPEIVTPATSEQIKVDLESSLEEDYLKDVGKRNKNFLVENIDKKERERIAEYIISKYSESIGAHRELCTKIDEREDVYNMERDELPGSDGNMPNYRMPISTVAVDVTHSNIMNVFFSPSQIARALPTEANDAAKIPKLDIFMNWSIQNELDIFTNCDRLWHSSNKQGETPYMMYWKKEYGVKIIRKPIINPADPNDVLYDEDTGEPLYQEVEEPTLIYNAPTLEVLSRKNYICAKNACIDKEPEWEGVFRNYSRDEYYRLELEGQVYKNTTEEIDDFGWGAGRFLSGDDSNSSEGSTSTEPEFLNYFGRFRIKQVKEGKTENQMIEEELEDEWIAIVHVPSRTLCQLRKNKFPHKMRPVDIDYFESEDTGRRVGHGIIERMDSLQRGYDTLFNQYIYGVTLSNSPTVFYEPTANMKKDPIKIQYGFLHSLLNTGSLKFLQIPPPNQTIVNAMEFFNRWAQLLFGISDYSAGVESTIDPSAPAKKAEIVVAQGNVRMNLVIRRKNKTLKNILKRWFLLYAENMPKNKFVRVAGEGANAFEFTPITIHDFKFDALPDFELTGNVLNANKTLEAQKKFGLYRNFMSNPLFNPQVPGGLSRISNITKWLADGVDEGTGLSRVLDLPKELDRGLSPEEENAMFLQGDFPAPTIKDNTGEHLAMHQRLLDDPMLPDLFKQAVMVHSNKHLVLEQSKQQQQMIQQTQLQGGGGGQQNQVSPGSPMGAPQGMVQGPPAGMGGSPIGNEGMPQ